MLASGSKGNSTLIASKNTRILVDAGLSCRELMRRMELTGEDPSTIDAILITHEHFDHVAGLAVLARKYDIPVFFTEQTHRAWVRMLTPKTTMTYAKWLENLENERAARTTAIAPAHKLAIASAPGFAGVATELQEFTDAENAGASLEMNAAKAEEDCEPSETRTAAKLNPTALPHVEYFQAGQRFCIGDIDVNPFTIPHDAADPCGFVFHARHESVRMAVATDLGYIPPNVSMALKNVDVLLLESNHDLEMLKDGPYPWSVKQRVLSRVGHLSNAACAEYLLRDYDGGAHTIVLGHLSEQNNLPELARYAAESAIGDRMTLLGNRVLLAVQETPLEPICL